MSWSSLIGVWMADVLRKLRAPTADSTESDTVAQTVGHKSDAATEGATASLVALNRETLSQIGLPTADAATNADIADVVGNKADAANVTADQASLVGLARDTNLEAHEIEEHLHHNERWMSELDTPIGETDVASPVLTDTSDSPFSLTASASTNTFGAWRPILGSDNTPVQGGMVAFDAHRARVHSTTTTAKNFRIQLAFGTGTATEAFNAGDWTEFDFWHNNQTRAGPIEIGSKPKANGTKLWARVKTIEGNGTFAFFYGLHEYPQ